MRRADRLFLIIHALRGRRATTARKLAELLEVSPRTVYRDICDLQLSGIPIEGEAGVGYTLRHGSEVPPLMFTRDEAEALVVGARFTAAFAGDRLASAARQAMLKVEAVLPDDLRRRTERSRVFAPSSRVRSAEGARLDDLHGAIDTGRVVGFRYVKEDGTPSERTVDPLCLAFWGRSWTLGAWCHARRDFRNFRVDRIDGLTIRADPVSQDPAHGLRAYLTAMGVPPDYEP